uniref:Uncharacterized protein n=1 Tax=Vitis vinifera TaxID=29760 RepID=F6I1J5_VITVI
MAVMLPSGDTAIGATRNQRGLIRIFHQTATASEFISVTVHSVLLRKLILTASSFGIIGNAAKLLSTLNKEAADKGDLPNLFIISSGQFPKVAKARSLVQSAKEKLDLLIGLYRKQL